MTRSGRQPKLAKRKNTAAWSHETEYLYTFGPEVAEIATLAGLEPDHNQQWILDQTFGRLADGRPSAFEVDIIGPRQNLKTATIIMIELGWGFVTDESLVIHTAHELDATEEAFIDLSARIQDTPQLAKYLDASKGERDSPGVITGNGSWEIHLLGDIKFKYKARRKDSGRALTADKVVIDEMFAVSPAMVGSLYPTLTTIPDAQVVSASSAGKLYSDVLRDHRKRGRAGSSPRQFYGEWGDPNAWTGCKAKNCDHALTAIGCALDDEKRWAQIMPAWGLRVFPETIRNMRQAMPPLEFAREFLVWWEDPPESGVGGVLDLARWGRLKDENAPAPTRVELMLYVSPDRRTSTIAAAGPGPDGRTLVLTTTLPGTGHTVTTLKALIDKHKVKTPVALIPNSQAGALIPQLEQDRIRWAPVTVVQYGQATAAFITGVNEENEFVHVGQDELDKAVAAATTRFNGQAEIWDDQRDSTVDLGPVVAASVAAYRWALAKKAPPPPPETLDSGASEPTAEPDISSIGF